MQVGVDVTCMCTNVGGCGFSGFRDIATFKNIQISSMGTFKFPPWWTIIVHGGQKIESTQKIYACRGVCEIGVR